MTTRTQVRCAGQMITEVIIRAQGPGYGGIFARSPFLGRMVASLHVTTAPSVIKNFILLKRGDRCNALKRSESERILRAMPFIADATVTAYPDGPDGVRLEVVTVDEPSIVTAIGVESSSPYVTAATVGNTNLLGNAVSATGSWRDGMFYRDRFAGRYTNYQLWGKPYQLELRGARRELGNDVLAEVSYPFLTDLQRSAWRVSGGSSGEYARFLRLDEPPAALRLDRRFMDAGAMLRIGRPGLLGLLGAQFSLEDIRPGTSPVVVTDSGIVADSSTAFAGRFARSQSTRVNLLLGIRRLQFMRVTGFDALNGPQDLRIGLQVGATIGRSLPSSKGAARQELFAGFSAYYGVGNQWSFAALQADIEGRRPAGLDKWDDVLSDGRIAWYVKPHPRHLITADVIWGGGWGARIPYQLALGASRGGLRGYSDADIGGARRAVARIEERWRTGSFRGSAETGVGIFADVGRVWAGDVPLGQN
ncbi:MAG: hypothetical protein ABIT38_23765, partial [Gemmatimonadaceae bacterium]